MNKTVNINLAGVFFHIDEDAYAKLQRYLAAIKRSFEGVQGEDEIIADIEARISELFTDKIKDARQVISTKELDEVITVMGQPEDYMVDDDIFEDATSSSNSRRSNSKRSGSNRKLFRDVDNAYIGGISSGFGHYLNVDPLWIRLAWIALVVLGFGSPILIYIILWILIPEATSTTDKLFMKGKQVNIDNIQEKVKEGFENVSDAVKNVDYGKINNQAQKGARGFFQGIGKIIMFFLKILAKVFGVILIITGAAVVISLLISVLTMGAVDIFNPGFTSIPELVNATNAPSWVVLLLALFAFGIPFFFLFYLGLKILSNNIKSMPLSGKLSLFGLWLVATIALGVLTINQFVAYSNTGKDVTKQELAIVKSDTLSIRMRGSQDFDIPMGRSNSYTQTRSTNGTKESILKNVRLIVRSTTEKNAYVVVEKRANGSSFQAAKDRAKTITYNYDIIERNLLLDGFFISDAGSRYMDQEVRVIVYAPEGSVLYADDNTNSYHSNKRQYRDILDSGNEEKFLKVGRKSLTCIDCPETESNNTARTWESDGDGDDWEYREYEGNDIPDWERDEQGSLQIEQKTSTRVKDSI
ncbi:MAG: phage shock protein PspC (stress-responsive transcriptional regulator) [Flavobacteriales bacterium]|jgi:phage shock protein PspC (stress-responsive transcriptional regulator)